MSLQKYNPMLNWAVFSSQCFTTVYDESVRGEHPPTVGFLFRAPVMEYGVEAGFPASERRMLDK